MVHVTMMHLILMKTVVVTYPASGYDCDGNLTCEYDLTTVSYVAASGTSYEYENAWQILDADGNIIWTSTYDTFGVNDPTDVPISPVSHNGLTADLCLDPNGCYTFDLYDTYGDGWNGNSLDVLVYLAQLHCFCRPLLYWIKL